MKVSDFSLTSPGPPQGQRDPNVFAPMAGRSYTDSAILGWLEAQHGALDMDDIDVAIGETHERLDRGRAWLDAHPETDPQYIRAMRLRGELEHRLRGLMTQYRVAAYACWVHCLEVYASLQHIDRAVWITENAPGRFSGDVPQGIWHALRGKQRPPGSWPPEDSEAWIERRILQSETWNVELLEDRLLKRAKTSEAE